jgi:hypothetical protein
VDPDGVCGLFWIDQSPTGSKIHSSLDYTSFNSFLNRPHERTIDDLEIIYDELLHVKALSHLSSLVKRELAGVLIFEAHPFKGEVCKGKIVGRKISCFYLCQIF